MIMKSNESLQEIKPTSSSGAAWRAMDGAAIDSVEINMMKHALHRRSARGPLGARLLGIRESEADRSNKNRPGSGRRFIRRRGAASSTSTTSTTPDPPTPAASQTSRSSVCRPSKQAVPSSVHRSKQSHQSIEASSPIFGPSDASGIPDLTKKFTLRSIKASEDNGHVEGKVTQILRFSTNIS